MSNSYDNQNLRQRMSNPEYWANDRSVVAMTGRGVGRYYDAIRGVIMGTLNLIPALIVCLVASLGLDNFTGTSLVPDVPVTFVATTADFVRTETNPSTDDGTPKDVILTVNGVESRFMNVANNWLPAPCDTDGDGTAECAFIPVSDSMASWISECVSLRNRNPDAQLRTYSESSWIPRLDRNSEIVQDLTSDTVTGDTSTSEDSDTESPTPDTGNSNAEDNNETESSDSN